MADENKIEGLSVKVDEGGGIAIQFADGRYAYANAESIYRMIGDSQPKEVITYDTSPRSNQVHP